MMRRDEMVGQITEGVRQVVQAMDATSIEEWLQLELTMAQLKALFVLAKAGPITISALALKLGIHLSAASHVGDRLVQLGLAERYEDPEDRRRTFVQPTARGSALVEQLRRGRRDRFFGWLSALSDEDLSALHRGLHALVEALPAPSC